MRLTSFEVAGFKNFFTPLRLDALEPFVVVHGDNNVGKSNLLEAMALFFSLLEAAVESKAGRTSRLEEHAGASGMGPGEVRRSRVWFAERGYDLRECFTFGVRKPVIRFAATLDTSDDTQGVSNPNLIHITAELSPSGDVYELRYSNEAVERLGHTLHGVETLKLIRADRSAVGSARATETDSIGREPRNEFPISLALQLHDAQEGPPGSAERKRWERFVEAMRRVETLTGSGTWKVIYDRTKGTAFVALETTEARIPLRAMGTGVQQIATIAAQILVSDAEIIAIEEPEQNLRGTNQLLVRDLLRDLLKAPEPPRQIIITSHSEAFGTDLPFVFLARQGPSVVAEIRHPNEAPPILRPPELVAPVDASAPRSWVTREGIVRLPQPLLTDLNIPEGGGLNFIREAEGGFRILTDEQLFGSSENGEVKE